MTAKRPMNIDDFWRLKLVGDVQLSPDGKTVAYVVGSYDERTNTLHSSIWLADIATGASRRFTTGETSDTQPRWSPDGAHLAFVSTRHEGKPQVFSMPVSGGEPRRLTGMNDGAHSPVWSPDGRRICFSSTLPSDRQRVPQETAWLDAHPDLGDGVPRMRLNSSLMFRFDGKGYIDRRTHLFLLDPHDPDTEPRQLTDGDWDDVSAAWSPDGELIAFMSNRTEDAERNWTADVWTVRVDDGQVAKLTNNDLTAHSPAWSPDGRTIAFYAEPEVIANGHQGVHLWLVSREGGDQRGVSGHFDRTCGGMVQPDYAIGGPPTPAWSPDGSEIYFLVRDGGDTAIYALDVAGGGIRRASEGPADITSVQCARAGAVVRDAPEVNNAPDVCNTPDACNPSLLVCLAATPTQPYDVFAVPPAGGTIRPVTQTNHELMNAVTVAPTGRVAFTGPDGWELEGWLVTPTHADAEPPYPLILHVHGGPQGAWGHSFYFQAQALAAAGYASLYINPRGSNGYGYDFMQAADWGDKDFADLMAGVDAVLERGDVDAQRLGITGISYGGFMTNWALGHTDRFAAGVSVNGISNLITDYGVSDIAALLWEHKRPGGYMASEEHWKYAHYHSPITSVERINVPLLLLQSENDWRCPITQAEELLTALRMRRKTVELIRFPNCSHAIIASGTPLQRYFQWKLALDWFDTYLKGYGQQVADEHEAGITVEPVPVP